MRKPKPTGNERTKAHARPYRVDRARSLNELEGWRPTPRAPGDATTSLVDACERACARPIGALTADELTRLLQQHFPGRFLVPVALDLLRDDPLRAARGVPGDLLQAVAARGDAFWEEHPHLRDELRALIAAHEPALAASDHASALVALDFLRRHR